MEKVNIHDFHFVGTKELKTKLLECYDILKKRNILKREEKLCNGKISATILYAITSLTPIMEKILVTEPEECGQPEIVNWDTHFHVYFIEDKESIYRMLKNIHSANNFFSMAKIVRRLLWYFVNEIEKNGFDRFMYYLKEIFNNWKKHKNKKKKYSKGNKKPKFDIINYLSIVYGHFNFPIEVNLLQ